MKRLAGLTDDAHAYYGMTLPDSWLRFLHKTRIGEKFQQEHRNAENVMQRTARRAPNWNKNIPSVFTRA